MSTKTEQMIAKILTLEAQKAELEEAIKNMRATLADKAEIGENLYGDYRVVKSTTTRFDDGMAKKNLTPAEYDSIAVLKADSKRAAALLDEDRLALCKKTFGSQVRITLRED